MDVNIMDVRQRIPDAGATNCKMYMEEKDAETGYGSYAIEYRDLIFRFTSL
jgi:hypothetical protein